MELTAYQSDVISGKICPYCKSETKIISELEVYGRTYRNRNIIACKNYPQCDSYVGTHDDGPTLGRLADKTLRQAKKEAHGYFDKLWRENYMDRYTAYEKLADHLNLPDKYTHIGMFSVETCQKVKAWATTQYKQLKSA